MLKLMPGVVDTNAREAPSWNLLSGLTINGRNTSTSTSPTTASTTRTPRRQSRRALGRLDCGDAAPVVELPGRVRPQLGCVDHPHHAQRVERLSWQRRVLQARLRTERQRVPADATVQARRSASCHAPFYEFDNVAWTLGGPVRARRDSTAAQPPVLLLVAGGAGQDRSRGAEPPAHADGARARRRFLADIRQRQQAPVFIRDPTRRGTAIGHERRAGMFRGQRHPGQSDRSHRAGAPQPLSPAERRRSVRPNRTTTPIRW